MQRLEVSGAVRPIYGSLGVKLALPQIIKFPPPHLLQNPKVSNWESVTGTCLQKNECSCFDEGRTAVCVDVIWIKGPSSSLMVVHFGAETEAFSEQNIYFTLNF